MYSENEEVILEVFVFTDVQIRWPLNVTHRNDLFIWVCFPCGMVQNCTFCSESDRHMANWMCICRLIPKSCQTHILARLPAVLAGLSCSFLCISRKYMDSVWNRLQISAVLYVLIIVNYLAFWFNAISCLQLCSWISSELYDTCF